MILYDLVCDKDHAFESWFRNSTAADKVLKAGHSPCPQCGSAKVRKAPMAPRLSRKSSDSSEPTHLPAEIAAKQPSTEIAAAMAKATEALTQLRETIEKNFEHVGGKFPEEARRIHYGEAPERAIYGDATLEEARDLTEEGIKVAALPWPKRRN